MWTTFSFAPCVIPYTNLFLTSLPPLPLRDGTLRFSTPWTFALLVLFAQFEVGSPHWSPVRRQLACIRSSEKLLMNPTLLALAGNADVLCACSEIFIPSPSDLPPAKVRMHSARNCFSLLSFPSSYSLIIGAHSFWRVLFSEALFSSLYHLPVRHRQPRPLSFCPLSPPPPPTKRTTRQLTDFFRIITLKDCATRSRPTLLALFFLSTAFLSGRGNGSRLGELLAIDPVRWQREFFVSRYGTLSAPLPCVPSIHYFLGSVAAWKSIQNPFSKIFSYLRKVPSTGRQAIWHPRLLF